MNIIQINNWDDERLRHYRVMHDNSFLREQGLFIVEGEYLLTRLLASNLDVISVLIAENRCAHLLPILNGNYPVFVLPEKQIMSLVGFQFHRGVLAIGRRRTIINAVDWLGSNPVSKLVILDNVQNCENLGSILRSCAAFGVQAIILGPGCGDPYYRRTVRVSMGAVLKQRLLKSENLVSDLTTLKNLKKFLLYATVVHDLAINLHQASSAAAIGLMFGNEAQGLAPGLVELADYKVSIPMQSGTDSLNVAVAGGIVLYHFWG